MYRFFLKLWIDDGGALIATEFLFVATILILGIIPGLVSLRNATNAELQETAQALNQSCPCGVGNCPDITCVSNGTSTSVDVAGSCTP